MKKHLNIIKKSPLFSGITVDEIQKMLPCLSAKKKEYIKGEIVLHSGDTVRTVGMVLRGSIDIEKYDFWGNRSILAKLGVSQIFGETYACIQTQFLNVNVIAAEQTEIMFLDIHKIVKSCTSACQFHARLIHNLLSVLAQKNLMLNGKLEHMAQRTTRSKLLSYLSYESQKHKNSYFEIPFNRQQLADYLSVDRSAMSNELSKLQNEGVLQFYKNKFKLLE